MVQHFWRLVFILLGCGAGFGAHAAGGDFVWARAMGGTFTDQGFGIALDSAGNVYTTGNFWLTADFDPGAGTVNLTSSGLSDIVVQKLDASGNLVWARAMGGTGFDEGFSIAVDSAGNVYTTGYFNGTVDFDPGAGTENLTSAGDSDIFVQKLNANGDFVWARAMGGTGEDIGFGLSVDSAGSVYTTGFFNGTVDFDPGAGTENLTSAGSLEIFVQKLDASGNMVWARRMGGTGSDSGRSISVDSAGSVYTTGFFNDTVDFDPGAGTENLSSVAIDDIFVQKLDASGNFVWARAMGGTNSDQGYGISVDSAGNVYTTGHFSDTVDFDPGAGTENFSIVGNQDIFVQKLDASGNFVWARAMGGSGFDRGLDIAVDSAGNIYTTGYFSNTVDFDPGAGTENLTSMGDTDIFVQKLDASGNLVWVRAMGGTGNDVATDIALDSVGDLYTTGQFDGTVDFDPGAGTTNLSGAGMNDIFVQKLTGSDLTPPNAVTITPATTGPTNAASVGFTVTFDEDVQNFSDAADLVIDHIGTAHSGVIVAGGPITYTATVTGISGDGSFTLAVNTGSDVQDLAGNALDSSVTSAAVSIDNTPPGVSIGAPSGSPVNSAGTANYPVVVSGADNVNLISGDVTLQHSGTAGGLVTVLNGTSALPLVQVSGVMGDGSYTISIAAGIAADAATNSSSAVGPSAAVAVDNTDPMFSNVVATPNSAELGQAVSISFDSTEALASDPDVTVNGNPAMRIAKAAFTYDYTVLSTDPGGPATIEISGIDSAGNANLLSNSTALTIVATTPELPVVAWPLGLALAAAGGLALRRKHRK